jgi:Protein of unknown function (DUF732)
VVTAIDCVKIATAVAVLATAACGVAHADSTDDHFWSFLQTHYGLSSSFTDQTDAVATAHTVCDLIRASQNFTSTAIALTHVKHMTDAAASEFVGVAIVAYCPQYKSLVGVS